MVCLRVLVSSSSPSFSCSCSSSQQELRKGQQQDEDEMILQIVNNFRGEEYKGVGDNRGSSCFLLKLLLPMGNTQVMALMGETDSAPFSLLDWIILQYTKDNSNRKKDIDNIHLVLNADILSVFSSISNKEEGDKVVRQVLDIAASTVCKTLTLQGGGGQQSSTSCSWPLNKDTEAILQAAISKRATPLKELVIRNVERLEVSSVKFIASILKEDQVLELSFRNTSWGNGSPWAGTIEFVIDILAEGLAKNTSLESFQLHHDYGGSSSCASSSAGRTSSFLSDRHMTKLVRALLAGGSLVQSKKSNLKRLELTDSNWHLSTLQAIGEFLRRSSTSTSTTTSSTNTTTRTQDGSSHGSGGCQLKELTLNRNDPYYQPAGGNGNNLGGQRCQYNKQLCMSQFVKDLVKNTSLEKLTLSQCSLDDQSYQLFVSNVWKCPNLKELNFPKNLITSLKVVVMNDSDQEETTRSVLQQPEQQERRNTRKITPSATSSTSSYLQQLDLTLNPVSPTQERQEGWVPSSSFSFVVEEECDYLKDLLEVHPFLGNLGEDFSKHCLLYTPQNQHLLDMNASGGRALLLGSSHRMLKKPRRMKRIMHDDDMTIQMNTSNNNDKRGMALPVSIWPHVMGQQRTFTSSSFSTSTTAAAAEYTINNICSTNSGCPRTANVIYHLLRDHFHHGPSIFGTASL